jgi:hypothetical protein
MALMDGEALSEMPAINALVALKTVVKTRKVVVR